jgi:hypothetical protein
MNMFGRRGEKAGAAGHGRGAVLAFSFCEPVTAIAMGKWHIREVGPEGLKFGGGVPNDALCGRELRFGWDMEAVFTAERALSMVTPREGDGHVFLCPACYQEYLVRASN